MIASNQQKPWAIVTDGARVFWTNLGSSRALMSYDVQSESTASIIQFYGKILNVCVLDTPRGALALFEGTLWWTIDGSTCAVGTLWSSDPVQYQLYGEDIVGLNGLAVSRNGTYLLESPDHILVATGALGSYSSAATLTGVAADDAGVYWLEGGDLVKQHDATKLSSTSVETLSAGIPTSEGIVVYDSYVYFTSTNGGIYRVPNVPGSAATKLVEGQDTPSGIAVDATGIYWTNRNASDGAVMWSPLDGHMAVPIAEHQLDPHGITLDAKTVYWTNTAGGQVMKLVK